MLLAITWKNCTCTIWTCLHQALPTAALLWKCGIISSLSCRCEAPARLQASFFSQTIDVIWCDHTNRLYGENKCGNPYYATAERSLTATFSQTCLILCISLIYLYRKSNFPQKNLKKDPVKYLSIQKIYRSNICFCGQGCIWDNIQIQPLAISH